MGVVLTSRCVRASGNVCVPGGELCLVPNIGLVWEIRSCIADTRCMPQLGKNGEVKLICAGGVVSPVKTRDSLEQLHMMAMSSLCLMPLWSLFGV
jgi:hypothetical protein